MKNDDPYQRAWHELESGAFGKALWARAFAEADGDENKAKAAYIRFRVAALTNEAREKVQQEAAEFARLRPEHLRAEILRRFSFLEKDYPPAAVDERVKSAVSSLSNTQWNNDPDKFIRAVIALDAALEATPSLKQEFFGTYLSDIVSEWQSKFGGGVSSQVNTTTISPQTSNAAAVQTVQDVDDQQYPGGERSVLGVAKMGNMGIGMKVGLSAIVVFIGALVYGLFRDLAGFGQYIFTAVEVLILGYIWTRPSGREDRQS
jgi:hypothetical protein